MRLLRPLLIVTALAIAVPAGVSAQSKTNAVYGGETLQTSGRPDPLSFFFAQNAKGGTVVLRPSGHYTCPDGQRPLGGTIVADAKPDGSYSFSQVGTGSSSGATYSTTATGSGRVTATQVVGKLRAVLTVKDAQGNVTDQCDTGELSYTLHRKRIQAGGSNQSDPVVIGLRPNRTPRYFLINYQTPDCAPSGAFTNVSTKVTALKRRSKGAFAAKGSEKFTGSTGTSFDVKYTLAGRVKGTMSHGTWKAVVNATDASGKPLLTNCSTGTIPWHVTAG
jgi:hypothetical protein